MKEKIQLIALDLDGTTLTRNKITPRTRRALERAIEQGVQVVVATGRVYAALPADVFTIRGLEYVITSNGAMITDLREKKVIHENCVDPEALKQVLELFRQNPQYPVEVFIGGFAYIDRTVYDEVKAGGYTFLSRDYILRTRKPVNRILEFLEEHIDAIENINIIFPTREEKAAMKPVLEAVGGITVTASTPRNLEIGGLTTSKASGLAALSCLTGTELKSVMACGDSLNDMAMLEEAGFGVAMANGEPEVLEMADYIAPSNEEEGVAFMVEKFVLGMERPIWQLAVLKVKNRTLSLCRRAAKKVKKRLQT